MSIQTVSVRIEESKREGLDRIAKALDRDRSYILNEAIDNYLDLHRWQLEQIEQGARDFAAGRSLATEQVRGRLKKHIAGRKKARK